MQDRSHSLCPCWHMGSDVGAGPCMWHVQGWTPEEVRNKVEGIREQDHNCMSGWESFLNTRAFAMSFFSPWSNWAYIVMSQVSPSWNHSGFHIPVAFRATFISNALSFIYSTSTFGSPLQQNHSCRFIFLTTAWPPRPSLCSLGVHSSQMLNTLKEIDATALLPSRDPISSPSSVVCSSNK